MNRAQSALVELIALAKHERRGRPIFQYLCELVPELANRLTLEERDLLETLPITGGKAADDQLNNRLLETWDRYDVLRLTMTRPQAMARLIVEFPEMDTEDLWETTRGGKRHLRELRKRRKNLSVLA